MKFESLHRVLKNQYPSRRPAFIWGPPGIGKSSVIENVAADLGIAHMVISLTALDPVDLRGMPHLVKGKMKFAPMMQLPTEGEGILLLDELANADIGVQVACYQLLLERRIGEYTLPDGWHVVAAGNRETDGCLTQQMSSAAANRMVHIELEPCLDAWLKWAAVKNIHESILAYLSFRRIHKVDYQNEYHNDYADTHIQYPDCGMLFYMPKDLGDGAKKGFASPRSWEMVDEHLKHQNIVDLAELIKGTVGERVSTEFMGFLRLYKDIPHVKEIFKNPTTAPLTENMSGRYAITCLIANNFTKKNLAAGKTYLDRMNSKELTTLAMTMACNKHPELKQSGTWITWAVDNQKDLATA